MQWALCQDQTKTSKLNYSGNYQIVNWAAFVIIVQQSGKGGSCNNIPTYRDKKWKQNQIKLPHGISLLLSK